VEEVMDLAKILDRYYIPTRYPNGFESGAPWTITLERTLRRRWILPEKSSIYARHLYRSRRALLRELKKAAEKLKEKHPEVLGVILFGSIARGITG